MSYLSVFTVAAFQPGTRVAFNDDTERFPHFIVPKGTTGTIIEADLWGIWVKVDTFVPGLSDSLDWKGEFHYSADDQALGEAPPFEVIEAAADAVPFLAGNNPARWCERNHGAF